MTMRDENTWTLTVAENLLNVIVELLQKYCLVKLNLKYVLIYRETLLEKLDLETISIKFFRCPRWEKKAYNLL